MRTRCAFGNPHVLLGLPWPNSAMIAEPSQENTMTYGGFCLDQQLTTAAGVIDGSSGVIAGCVMLLVDLAG